MRTFWPFWGLGSRVEAQKPQRLTCFLNLDAVRLVDCAFGWWASPSLWVLPVRCVGVGERLGRSRLVWPWSSWCGGLRVVRLVVRALGLLALSGGEALGRSPAG